MSALESNLFGRSGLRSFRNQPLNHRSGGLNRQFDAAPRREHLRNYGAIDNLENIGGSYFRNPQFQQINRVKKREDLTKKPEKDAVFELPEDFAWRDNENDKAERSGKPPDATYVLSDYRLDEFDEKFFGPRYKNLIHISRKTGAHLNIPRDPSKPAIEIWGTKEEIEASRRDLKLLEEYTHENCRVAGKKASRTFKRIRAAPSYRKLEKIREKMKEDARKKMLRGKPSSELILPVTSYVIWPKDISPITHFGTHLPALDPIRWDCNCFINWEPTLSAFFIQGKSQDNVLECKERVFGLYCEIAAARRTPVRAFLLEPPPSSSMKTHVSLNTKHGFVGKQLTFDRTSQIGAFPLLTGPAPNSKFLAYWEKERQVLKRANVDYIRRLLQQGIDDIFFLKGNVKMKVNFGTIILNGYKRPTKGNSLEFEDFMESLHSENTEGELIRDIGGIMVAGQIYAECLKRPDVFSMVNYGIGGTDALAVQYTIQAVFEIRLFKDDGQYEDCRLDVEFAQESDAEKFSVWSAYWSVLPQKSASGDKDADLGGYRRRLPLSVNVLDLDADCGWNIEFSRFKVLADTDIYPIFPEFLRLLKIEKVPDDSMEENAKEPGVEIPNVYRVSYVNLPGLIVHAVTQKTKHQFWMGMSDYIFEVVKYEHIPTRKLDFPVNVPISLTKDERQKVKIERRFGAGLYSYGWQHHLASQRFGPIGKGADWVPSMDTFFHASKSNDGPDGKPWASGWDEFMGRVDQCIEVIAMAKKMVKSGTGIKQIDDEEAAAEVWDRY